MIRLLRLTNSSTAWAPCPMGPKRTEGIPASPVKAESAQNEHDAMIKIYEEADKLRKEADESQEKFIETKGKADEEHRRHIDHIRQVHDYDKIITGLRQKARKARKKKDESVAMKEAEDIFDKFKKGEKLSTEDLMVLQKSGYL